jgi:hypothetical protein
MQVAKIYTDEDIYGEFASPQYEFGELLRRVLKLLKSVAADKLGNQIKYLQAFK